MHELFLVALPLVGVPLLALRLWVAGPLSARRTSHQIGIGDKPELRGSYPEAGGGRLDLGSMHGETRVLVFMSNRCPGVMAYDERLNDLAGRFEGKGVRFLGVNSVPDTLYPREGLADMRTSAIERGLAFPYVKDADQVLARTLNAQCTPQVFVVDKRGILRYRGRIDDSFLPSRVKVRELSDALDALAAGREVATPETPALGCHLDLVATAAEARSSAGPVTVMSA